ncbi:MAG: sigma-70 family RNA polymerase sigma factor [Chryseolinea sp.]
MEGVERLVDKLYRSHFGLLVASLMAYSREITLESAEDIVQDAFSTAITEWKHELPQNPVGWIFKVCRNKAINWLQRQSSRSDIKLNGSDRIAEVWQEFTESRLEDYQLRLLFACAHPSLAPKAQVAITLKYVANFRVETIASALAMTIDGVDKILVRARQKLNDEKILLRDPPASLLASRLPVVHKILYLIFSEGYRSTSGRELIRAELCEDALIMCRLLIQSGVGDSETEALYSLMLFNSARLDARFDDRGNIVGLENQDRGRWNNQLIALGIEYLNQSREEVVSAYHLEAGIACLHCSATDFVSTDWSTIARLYGQLLRRRHNPFVEVNHAIALYYSGARQDAFDRLEALHQHPFFNQYFPLTLALGKLHGLEGRKELSEKFFAQAITQTRLHAEKEFVRQMMGGDN